jgi:hypothetical protein
LLLESVTTVLSVAAAVKDTEHLSVVGPVNVFLSHEILVSVATGAGAGEESGDSVIASICDTPSAVAVSFAFSGLLTANAVALKPTFVSPAGTFTEAGTFKSLLLLESVTTVWLPAAAHASVVGPLNVCFSHEILLNVPAPGADAERG